MINLRYCGKVCFYKEDGILYLSWEDFEILDNLVEELKDITPKKDKILWTWQLTRVAYDERI